MDNDTYLDELANVINKAGSTPDAITGIIELDEKRIRQGENSIQQVKTKNGKEKEVPENLTAEIQKEMAGRSSKKPEKVLAQVTDTLQQYMSEGRSVSGVVIGEDGNSTIYEDDERE